MATAIIRSPRLIHLRARTLHYVRPLRRLAAHQREEFLRRAAVDLAVEAAVALDDRWHGQRGLDLGVQALHYLARQPRRADDAAPRVRFVAGHARLGERRDVGERG